MTEKLTKVEDLLGERNNEKGHWNEAMWIVTKYIRMFLLKNKTRCDVCGKWKVTGTYNGSDGFGIFRREGRKIS